MTRTEISVSVPEMSHAACRFAEEDGSDCKFEVHGGQSAELKANSFSEGCWQLATRKYPQHLRRFSSGKSSRDTAVSNPPRSASQSSHTEIPREFAGILPETLRSENRLELALLSFCAIA